MADQGLIATQFKEAKVMKFLRFSTGITAVLPQDATITGTTKIAGTITGGVVVWLLWRPTMTMLDRTISAADGTYTFNNVPRHATLLAVYFTNKDATVTEDDIVYSQINTV